MFAAVVACVRSWLDGAFYKLARTHLKTLLDGEGLRRHTGEPLPQVRVVGTVQWKRKYWDMCTLSNDLAGMINRDYARRRYVWDHI